MTDVTQVADHLFRHEAGKLVSVLTGIFGIERLQLAEDVVQESLVRALKTWPYYGVPENPPAWITQTAKRLALDALRREKVLRVKQPDIFESLERWSADPAAEFEESEIKDARLRLMFACCHPLIPQESQTALALKTLCGFSVEEIAKAFLTTSAAIAKRLIRAKSRIKEQDIPLEIPSGEDLTCRLDGVLQTLYLLFNEGYNASTGDNLIRDELCFEAIRLGNLVSEHKSGDRPHTHALLALMMFNASRLRSRVDDSGQILRLKDQDRSLWDQALIAQGLAHMGRSMIGSNLSAWHLEAGIAGCHCSAADYSSTDWSLILSFYNHLVKMDPSPVVALNMSVATAQVHGPRAGLDALDKIPNKDALESYYLLYAVQAEFEAQLRDYSVAAAHLRRAMELTEMKSEQSLLADRLKDCEEKSVNTAGASSQTPCTSRPNSRGPVGFTKSERRS